MKIKLVLNVVMVILAMAAPVMGGQQAVSVIFPPDKTVMEFNILSVAMQVDTDKTDLIKVRVNDKDVKLIKPDNKFECFSVTTVVGINRIFIEASKEGRTSETAKLEVFQRSDLNRASVKPPEGFRRVNFHMKDDTRCAGCHTLIPSKSDRKPVSVSAFPSGAGPNDKILGSETSTCYSCHKSMTEYPFVHVPAYVWSCLSCHEYGAKPRYAVRKPDTKMCFGCHIKQKEEWDAKKYFHGPVNTGKCAICHNPHASENPFNLIKSTWNLCVSCHTEKGSGKHIVEGYFNIDHHPTRGKPDPLNRQKELSCASCHDPHASNNPKLWKYDVVSGFELCHKCHNT